ncbi:hypothetical protein BJV74DRAFT_836901 [Russula compacta]|nr:hypothetical protein BJV74DRAFT_836901 [Russula compacta]
MSPCTETSCTFIVSDYHESHCYPCRQLFYHLLARHGHALSPFLPSISFRIYLSGLPSIASPRLFLNPVPLSVGS